MVWIQEITGPGKLESYQRKAFPVKEERFWTRYHIQSCGLLGWKETIDYLRKRSLEGIGVVKVIWKWHHREYKDRDTALEELILRWDSVF